MENVVPVIAIGLFVGIGLVIFARIDQWRRLRRAEQIFDVGALTKLGWGIETETAREVVVVRSQRINHVLHLFLTIFTLGTWSIVWICLAIFGDEKRRAFIKPSIRPPDADGAE